MHYILLFSAWTSFKRTTIVALQWYIYSLPLDLASPPHLLLHACYHGARSMCRCSLSPVLHIEYHCIQLNSEKLATTSKSTIKELRERGKLSLDNNINIIILLFEGRYASKSEWMMFEGLKYFNTGASSYSNLPTYVDIYYVALLIWRRVIR